MKEHPVMARYILWHREADWPAEMRHSIADTDDRQEMATIYQENRAFDPPGHEYVLEDKEDGVLHETPDAIETALCSSTMTFAMH
jgi:hypothetical protein